MLNLEPPPGFQGLREDLPVEMYVRHLPHWRQEGATYFVTFRLADSLPQTKLEDWADFRREWERRHPRPWSKEVLEKFGREMMQEIEQWLDKGIGRCLLATQSCASFVTESMHHFDNDRDELDAYVVMPNHCHVLLRPLVCEKNPLETILGSWKQFSSKRINALTGQQGELWQDECCDRIVRNEDHLYRCLQYIGRNPKRAGLARANCPLWVRPEWAALGRGFEDEMSR